MAEELLGNPGADAPGDGPGDPPGDVVSEDADGDAEVGAGADPGNEVAGGAVACVAVDEV